MIEIKSLTYSYDSKFSALFEIDLNINQNTLILSDELSSKTLFRLLTKQYKDYQGEILINNINLKQTKIKDLSISYITNPPYLIKNKLASYNLAYPLIVRKEDKKQSFQTQYNVLFYYL